MLVLRHQKVLGKIVNNKIKKENRMKSMKTIVLSLVALLSFMGNAWADNSYGLKDNIQDGVILHCFDWKLNDIKAEIPAIAKAGFTAVQTSPIHQKEGYGSVWYMAYQPYDYVIGNGLGSADDLRALCSEAHKYGVKVIVDVVANHTNGNLNYVADFWKNTDLYHNYGGVSNWNDRYQVTHGEIGMKDLKTEDSRVQQKIHAYVESLKSCGVDGIRWDAAKHIGLPSEGDSFWQNVPDQSMYNYGEILDGTGGNDSQLLPEYQKYISITDNVYGNGFASSFSSGSVNGSIGNFNQRGASTTKLVYWGESHDTYANDGGSSKYMSQNVIDRAYAVVAGNNSATALYFSRPSSTDKNSMKLGQKGSTHFTSTEVAEVNHMHNICASEPNYYVHSGNVAAQVRKSGAVIVLGNGNNQSVSFANGAGDGKWLTTGTYTDKVGGGTFTVTSSTISGRVGSTGIAVIYKGGSSTGGNTGGETGGNTGSEVTNAYTPTLDNANEVSCFFETSDANGVKAWIWDDTNNYTGGSWPGESMTLMGKASNGNYIYKWTYNGTLPTTPTNVIFTHNGETRFNDTDGTFTNHGYYTGSSAISATQIITKVKEGDNTGGNTGDNTGGETGDNTNIHVYVRASSAPYIYVWYDNNGATEELNGSWYSTKTMTASSTGWYVYTAPAGVSPINFILTSTAGGDKLTGDVKGVTADIYYAVNGSSATETTERPNGSGSTTTDSEITLENNDEISVFFETSGSETPYVYTWKDGTTWLTAEWPGDIMTLYTTLASGAKVYKWIYTGTETELPTGLLFTHDGGSKYDNTNGTFTNHGYYTASSPKTSVKTIAEAKAITTAIFSLERQESENNTIYYTLSGNRLNTKPTRPGIYVRSGKKIVIR